MENLLLIPFIICLTFAFFYYTDKIVDALDKRNKEKEAIQLRNPDMNTNSWEIHKQRMIRSERSQFRGTYYYVGPRGGWYYINSNGRRTYV